LIALLFSKLGKYNSASGSDTLDKPWLMLTIVLSWTNYTLSCLRPILNLAFQVTGEVEVAPSIVRQVGGEIVKRMDDQRDGIMVNCKIS